VGPLSHPWGMFGGESGTGNPAVRSGHIRHSVANRGVLRTRQSHGWQSGPTDEEHSGGIERRCQSPNMEKMGNYTFFMLPRFGARHLYCHLLSPLQRGSRAILATRPVWLTAGLVRALKATRRGKRYTDESLPLNCGIQARTPSVYCTRRQH
jgi:hypothetical protein